MPLNELQQAILRRLDGEDRLVVQLHFASELEPTEIAQVLWPDLPRRQGEDRAAAILACVQATALAEIRRSDVA